MATLRAPYSPHQPTKTVLYGAIRENLETFLRWTKETYEKSLPQYVEDELRGYLRCGVFAHGFVRARCDACGHDLLVAFSCKNRGVCPSCGGRRMANTAAHLVDRVLPNVPVRQWVLSLPHELRRLAAFDPRVLTALDRLFVEEVLACHRRRARADGLPDTNAGAVTFVQRFGGSLNLNIHFHVVVLDGVFERSGDSVVFHEAVPPSQGDLDDVLSRTTRRILTWLRRHGHISAEDDSASDPSEPSALDACAAVAMQRGLFEKLPDQDEGDTDESAVDPPKSRFTAEQLGFSLHAGVRMAAADDIGRERLCRYGARPPFALPRLRRLRDGRYAYRTKYARAGHAQHRVMTPMELLARLAALVPPPRYPLVRFHGVLAPRSSWRALVIPRPPDTPSPCVPHVARDQSSDVPSSRVSPSRPPRGVSSREPSSHVTNEGSSATPSSPAPPNTHPPRNTPSHMAARTQAIILAPNVLAVSHWTRLAEGLLQATSPRVDWPTLLRRTFDIDVLACARCGGRLRVLAVVTRTESVRAILTHLDILSTPPATTRARDPTDLVDPHLDA